MKTNFFLSIASSMAILLSISHTCFAQGMDVGNNTSCSVTLKAEYVNATTCVVTGFNTKTVSAWSSDYFNAPPSGTKYHIVTLTAGTVVIDACVGPTTQTYTNCNGVKSKMYFDPIPGTTTDGAVILEE